MYKPKRLSAQKRLQREQRLLYIRDAVIMTGMVTWGGIILAVIVCSLYVVCLAVGL